MRNTWTVIKGQKMEEVQFGHLPDGQTISSRNELVLYPAVDVSGYGMTNDI